MMNITNTVPIAWTIAANDSSSGAGIQADLAVFTYFGVHGCSVITKLTAQNTQCIAASSIVEFDMFCRQLEALAVDLPARSIKISVLGDSRQIKYLSQFLAEYEGFTIYDPVLVSSTGTSLTDAKLIRQISRELLPQIDLLTPNVAEVNQLTGIKIASYDDMLFAGQMLLQMGSKNILIKGGHFIDCEDSMLVRDLFISQSQYFWILSSKREFVLNIHGTGCCLSSAIAANVALGYSLEEAIIIAKRYLNAAIRLCRLPLKSAGQYYIQHAKCAVINEDMPWLFKSCMVNFRKCIFLPCAPVGLYPVIEQSKWIHLLAPAGVKTIQLRIKTDDMIYLEREIKQAITLANYYGINLFINDYWELALKYNAYGVHLGQEDILTADIERICAGNLKLGISTHSYTELATALAFHPSYIALGPVFATTSKTMPWQPQGIARLKEWRSMLNNSCQLVAIGGINLSNIHQIVAAGVDNVALISGITKAADPVAVTRALIGKINSLAKFGTLHGEGLGVG